MSSRNIEEIGKVATFGRRKVAPRVCIADSKQHIRTFLSEALEEHGFITCECAHVGEIDAVLDSHLPDLIILGFSAGGVETGRMLKGLAAKAFDGKVLLLGPRDSRVVEAVGRLGEEFGLAMLPPLATPFGAEGLRASIVAFLPAEAPLSLRSTRPKPCTRVGSSSGTNRKSTRKHSACTKPKASFVFAIQPGGSFRRLISFRMTATPTWAHCRNS